MEMKVYRTVEFSERDLKTIHEMQWISHLIDQYRLKDELELCDWISFTGNLDKLEEYMKEHMEMKSK